LHGAERRCFAAEMALKYCDGNARQAEQLFGWGRAMVETGLGEKRTGIVCLSAKGSFTGNKRWEEKHPEAAEQLCRLAEAHSQQDPSFHATLAFTRLTAKEGLRHLRDLGLVLAPKLRLGRSRGKLCFQFESHSQSGQEGRWLRGKKGMQFIVETEQEADRRWLAEVLEIPGVMKYGAAREEAVANAEALALRVIADRIEQGEQVVEPINITFAA
jgi:predicted RNase H-like HicB family nuclease